MKNILLIVFALVLATTFNSCKKCDTCVKRCEICNLGGSPTSVCANAYGDEAAYVAAIQAYELAGYTCTTANETDEVCTSGLFYKLRHQSDIDAKESDGFDCN
ncbi:MAG: hypothetical protein U0T74_08985 [Chitinophagales bacterium]